MKLWTVTEIAGALGQAYGRTIDRKQAYRWLEGVPPTGECEVNGQATKGWSYKDMPAPLRERFESAAKSEHIQDGETLLAKYSNPELVKVLAAPWQPSVPLKEICPEDVRAAKTLAEALRVPIARRNEPGITAAELQQLGCDEYKRAFGHEIEPVTWDRLFKRTLERAGAFEDFHRWEIYLSERPKRAAAAVEAAADSAPFDFAVLRTIIDQFTKPATQGDLVNLWQHAFLWLEETDEEVRKEAKRALISFLFTHTDISKTEDALRRNFDRTYSAWIADGRQVAALQDARKDERPIIYCFTPEDVDEITYRAGRYHRCEITPAVWAAHREGKLTIGLSVWLDDLKEKHRTIPASLREAVQKKMRIVRHYFQGPRAVNRHRAFIDRDPEKVWSLRCVTADDLTPCVVSYWPDGKGWYDFGRPQIIAGIDFRSWAVLEFCCTPTRTFNSLMVRELMNNIIREEGIPEVFYHEGGAFDADGITGSRAQPLSKNDFQTGLAAIGMRFIHARNPEAKANIEKSWDLIQDRMAPLPGHTGREERRDRPEILTKQMALVKARKAHPGEFWMSFEDYPEGSPHRSQFGSWLVKLDELFHDFNTSPMFGKYHQGLTPEQVFEKCKNVNDPPRSLGPEHYWMFGYCIETTVRDRLGISFRIGGKRFRYFGPETSPLIGQRVRAWFDPKHPELLPVTDLNNRHPFVVERANPGVDPLDGGEELSVELERADAHASFGKAYFKHLKRKFEPTVRRMITDVAAIEVAKEYEARKKKSAQREQARAKQKVEAERIARETGLPLELVADDPERWLPYLEAKRAGAIRKQIETEGAQ